MCGARPSRAQPLTCWPPTGICSARLPNLGYISGALKHAFDVAYYQILDSTRGRPFGLYLHGNEGTEGAERAVAAITNGLGWEQASQTVVVSGKPTKTDLEACWNLGATVAAQLME